MKPRRSANHIAGDSTIRTRHADWCNVRWGTLVFSFASLCLAGKSIANPLGERLRSGSAEFVRENGNLLVRQGSEKLILDWKDFSIGEGESTRFLQPGSGSAALNRVYGGNPSSIYGSLQANGKIYLINPNGVFIGPSGRVDAGSFIASTLDVSNDEFLKGGDLTLKGASDASVVNFGTITALDGDAFLIARTVENHGSISAPNGTAGLAAGTEVVLQPAGEEKIGVSIASGSGKVVNTGTIAAAQAELKAAGGNLYALAIKNTGTIRATGVERRAGRVFLRANAGTIENAGGVRAKNVNGSGGRIAVGRAGKPGSKSGVRVVNRGVADASGSNGGVVSISADEVSLTESSQLLATGATGAGGMVTIDASLRIDDVAGGVINASGTTGGSIELAAGGTIDASGTLLANGDTGVGGEIRITGHDVRAGGTASLVADGFLGGGSIRALAENAMEFHGVISARALGGNANGGFAEVSGLNSLVYDGMAYLGASFGESGTLLLDPANFTIDAATAAVIVSNLEAGNVVIATSSSGSASGDIFVNSAIIYDCSNNLSLLAHRHIEVNASIQNSGAGAINLVSGWDGLTGSMGNFETISAAPSSFGNGGGSIFIGSGNQSSAIAVGSRFGATNAAGSGMTLNGSNQSNTASAQFGFRAEAGAGGFVTNGRIQIALKDDLTVTGGGSNFSYAQIGHGGQSSNGSFQGAISIDVAGDLQINGGVNFSYAQIGHGGEGSSGVQAGDIVVRASNLGLTGGSRPHANAQIGHGDGSGDASGTRTGLIDVRANGETTLMNGPGNNAIWLIGHGTNTPSGVSNANVLFSTGALDYTASSVASQVTLNQDFTDKFGRNLLGGDITIRASGTGGLVVNGGFTYNSSNSLALVADASATINGSIINAGPGEVALVIDNANAVRPNLNSAATLTIAPTATLQSGGSIRIFSVDPANTHLGSFTPANRRYNVWYGDAVTVSGVNFKIQPTLTLTANSFTKTYGQTVTLDGIEFTVTGLQSGDSLSQILAGDPRLSSFGSVATAGVTGSPYSIVFDPGLTTDFGYGLQLIPGTLTVTPALLTLSAINQSKVYGNTLTFAGTEFSTTGLRNGEVVGTVDVTSLGAIATAEVSASPYAITMANPRGGTFDPANYTISLLPGVLTITQAPLTITASNQSKIYGNLLTLNGTEFTSVGLLNNDTISNAVLTSLGTGATAGVGGAPYTINIGGAIGTGLGNYVITYVPGALAVAPAPLTFTALNQSKIYGSTLAFAGNEFSAAGLKNGESVGLVDLGSSGAVATAGVAGSPYAIAIANPRGGTFDSANYTISYAEGTLTVTPAPLTITASNQSKVYGSSLVLNGTEFTSVGLLNNDTISGAIIGSPGTAAVTGVTGSPYPISIGGANGTGLGNYTIAYVPGALTVTPAPLTLTALNQSKIYGNTFTFGGTEFSSVGLKNGESVGLVDLASPGAVATAGFTGSPYAITIANARGGTFDSANYAISYVPGALTVTQAALTITALNQSKVYGGALAFTGTEFTSVGLLDGHTIASVSLASFGSVTTAGVAASPYTITIGGAIGSGLENYTISYVPGSLAVTPALLTLTAIDHSKIYGSTLTFAGTEFSASGLKNGESVGMVDLASTGAVPTAGVIGGPYPVTITNPRGGTFDPANYTINFTNGALAVTPAPLTLTALDQTKVYGSVLTFAGTEFSATGLQNGEKVGVVDLTSFGTAATAGVVGNPYAITIANARGGSFDTANYSIGYDSGALTVTPAALTVTALNQSKGYGSLLTLNGTEFTSVGLLNGDMIASTSVTSLGTVATAGVVGSPYPINIGNAIGTGLGNYTIAYVPAALTVTPAQLTLSALNQSKVYGKTLTFTGIEFTAAGLQNGEFVGSVDLASTGAVSTAGVAGSPYAITIANPQGGTFDAANYAISFAPGTLTVTQASLTIAALDQSKVYGSSLTLNGTEFTSVGLLNSDTISSTNLGSLGATATAGVSGGPYAISIGGALGGGLENYAITYVPGQLAVTPAPLILTALNQSKVYGSTLTFTGAEFTAIGLQNGESVGIVDLASHGTSPTAGVAGGPYEITIDNPHGGTFDPANYAISYGSGELAVTPAALVITPIDQRKRMGTDLIFAGTEFRVSGIQNGETIGFVALSSDGAAGSANVGTYALRSADASGGTYDPANYTVVYESGTLDVFPKPIPPPPPPKSEPPKRDLPKVDPPKGPDYSLEDLLRLLDLIEQGNQSTAQNGSDLASDGPSTISGFGIQRLNLNTFYGEQLIEPGGAMMIDATGLGPLLPIGEAPQDLEQHLAEDPHGTLEEAIAEDDQKEPTFSSTRHYDVSPGQVFRANAPGEVGFEELSSGPAVLRQATDLRIEMQLIPAATR